MQLFHSLLRQHFDAVLVGSSFNVEFGNVATDSDGRHVKVLSGLGNLRALAVTGERRIASLPDVPTMSETLAGFVAAPWNGVVAPPNTPVAIADKISSAIADMWN